MGLFGVDYSTVILTAVLVVYGLVLWWRRRCRHAGLPPGPTPLPLIGNLHLLLPGKDARKVLIDQGKIYGDVFTFYLGSVPTVIFNSHESNKEAMSMDAFAGRSNYGGAVAQTSAGIISSEGGVWKTNRKLCLRHLSQMGFGKKSFETKILDEVGALLDRVEKRNGERFDITVNLANAVSNLICQMAFGKGYGHEEPEFVKLLKSLREIAIVSFMFVFAPFLTKVPFVNRPVLQSSQALRSLNSVVARYLSEHKKEDPDTVEKDIIHVYVNGQRNGAVADKVLDPAVFEDRNIRNTVLDLFAAGTETTTSTLRWTLVYLVNFPDVQEKLRVEVHEIVGINRMPSLADKPNMPFTLAFLAEIQRHSSLIPYGVPHKAVEDASFRGYIIPKDTQIFSNTYAVSMDEKYFPSAQTFRPERFIDVSGQFKASLADKMIPFGVGKRVCLGESLARMEIFLFITSLVQRFEFKTPEGSTKLSTEGSADFLNTPGNFEICATPV